MAQAPAGSWQGYCRRGKGFPRGPVADRRGWQGASFTNVLFSPRRRVGESHSPALGLTPLMDVSRETDPGMDAAALQATGGRGIPGPVYSPSGAAKCSAPVIARAKVYVEQKPLLVIAPGHPLPAASALRNAGVRCPVTGRNPGHGPSGPPIRPALAQGG